MSKSVLIIETPPCCEDCPCSTIVKAPQIGCWSANCEVCGKFNDMIMTKPEWCPLKPMPTPKEVIEEANLEAMFNDGYNACIEELEDPNGFNYETIKALKDSEEGKNMSKTYETFDELIADIEDELEGEE